VARNIFFYMGLNPADIFPISKMLGLATISARVSLGTVSAQDNTWQTSWVQSQLEVHTAEIRRYVPTVAAVALVVASTAHAVAACCRFLLLRLLLLSVLHTYVHT